MKLDPKAIATAAELKSVLESHQAVGKATIADVQQFLKDNGINCSSVVEKTERTFWGINKFVELTTQPFDSFIGCRLPSPQRRSPRRGWKPWIWIGDWISDSLIFAEYAVQFHFSGDKLVEIIAIQQYTGL
jgi:hypothetical protein